MKAPIRTFLIACTIVGFSASGNLSAQWKQIPMIQIANYFPIQLGNADLGAIHFKDGVLWAGWRDLYSSNDTGKKWQKITIGLPLGYIITDINFFDKLNGLVSTAYLLDPPTSQGILFQTNDGGLSWKRILTISSEIPNIAYNGSPNIIHVIAEDGIFYTSMDAGVTWKNKRPGVDLGSCFTIAKDNTIYALTTMFDPNGDIATVSFSTDLGTTWNVTPGTPDGDSHSICTDSCDAKKLYVASEDYESTIAPLNLSQLFYSTNSGNSWTSSVAFAAPYLTGAMTCTANTIYSSSIGAGIYRSTDRGLTWKNIGGKFGCAFDARNIACVNDNIVFVLDAEGSIWETTNSGGDSLKPLVFSQNALFSTDSIIVCDTFISASITLQTQGCTPIIITKIEVIGADSLSYTATQITGDSVSINFFPLSDKLNSAQLVLTLSDGSKKTVILGGYGIPRIPLTLTTAQNQNVDTLGAAVIVPITINGFRKPENITLVMHYDTVLNYNGATSPAGVKLDMLNEQWKGRSKLSIPNVTSNVILGFAHFDVFNDSVPLQHVTFDSVTVLTAITACQYISPTVTSTITPLSGCGILTLSHYLHHNQVPELSISPNPTSGDISITSSMNLGECSVTIYDMLGIEKDNQSITIGKNSYAKILLPVGNGVYAVRIKSVLGSYDLRVVVNK